MTNKKDAGFTIVEVLTAIALMGIVTYGIVAGTTLLFRTEFDTGTLGDENKLVQSIIENINTDPAIYQKNFTNTAISTNDLLKPNTLPLAYAKNYFGPRATCPNPCSGYIGYVIRPLPGTPGLFEVSLRLAKIIDENGNLDIKNYEFLTQSN